jgi:hypothetical protein
MTCHQNMGPGNELIPDLTESNFIMNFAGIRQARWKLDISSYLNPFYL